MANSWIPSESHHLLSSGSSSSSAANYPLTSIGSVASMATNGAFASSSALYSANYKGASFIGNSEFQTVYSNGTSGSSFAPEKTFDASNLFAGAGSNAQTTFGLPAFSATVQAAQKGAVFNADGTVKTAEGIFATAGFADPTKAGASYFDANAWTKDFKLVAGNSNAYTVQATSDDGKKVVTITEVATGKDPYGATGPGANGTVSETVVITGSDNDRFVGTYASNAVNVPDASTIAGSSVDVLNTSRATNYVNVNKGIASAYKAVNAHNYKEANGVQVLADANETAYTYKDKGLTIIDSQKSASNSVNYTKLDKATLAANSANNFYYDNSNPLNAVKVQFTQATTHTYNKTAAATFKDVVTTNLAQYKVSDNTNLDGFKLDAKGIITATTTDAAVTAYTYTNPALTIANNAYQLTVKSFATAANGLAYAAGGSFADNSGLGIVYDTTPARGVVYADQANNIAAREAVTSITGTINNDEIKIVIPVDKTTGLNASKTADAGTTTGGTANGGAGNDTIIGGALDDVLTGAIAGDDQGADVLTGGAGKDIFNFGELDTITDFNVLEDTANFVGTDLSKAKAIAVKVQLDKDGNSVPMNLFTESTDAAEIAKFAKLAGAKYDITGTDKGDVILGGKNADKIDGGKGDDNLSGLLGSDTIIAGEGSDTVRGGGGIDTIDLTEKTQVKDVIDYSSRNNFANLKQVAMENASIADDPKTPAVNELADALAKAGDFVTGFASGVDKILLSATLDARGNALGKVDGALVKAGGVAYAAGNSLRAEDFVAVKFGDATSVLTANVAEKGRFIFDTASKVLFFDEKGDTAVAAGVVSGNTDDLAVIRLTGATDTLVATDFIFA